MLLSPQDLQNFFWPRSAKKENAPCPKWQGVLACDPVGIQTQDLQNRNLFTETFCLTFVYYCFVFLNFCF